MPPIVKIYEAMGALGDGRVRLDERGGEIESSDGSKTYRVDVSGDGREISSNDNASFWQGYLGYPGVAVLLARGLYRPPANVIDALAGIPWKQLNDQFHNDYDKTIAEVSRIVEASGHDPDAIRIEAEAVIEALRKLSPTQGKRRRPPKSKMARRSRDTL